MGRRVLGERTASLEPNRKEWDLHGNCSLEEHVPVPWLWFQAVAPSLLLGLMLGPIACCGCQCVLVGMEHWTPGP